MSKLHAASKSQFSSLYQQTIRGMCMIAIPAAVTVLVFSDQIISLLFDPEYFEATTILQVLIWGLLIEFLNPFLSHALFAQGDQRRSMYVAALSLAFNVLVTLALVWRYQAVGAAAGTVLSGLFATLLYMHYLMPRREILGSVVSIVRIAISASLAGLLLFAVQAKPLPIIVGVGISSYAILLFVFQAIRSEDLDVVRSLVRTRAI
jgi:O-antigen/teichoic acid export membrane protein